MLRIDDFARPAEHVSPMEKHLRAVIRRFVDERVLPARRGFDEDWKEHRLVGPLLDELMAGIGLQRALFPVELGGWGFGRSGSLHTVSYAICEELGRGDTGLAVAALVTLWPLATILVEPHVNARLAAELAPRFCRTDRAVFAALAMTEPQGGSDIENMGLLGGRTLRTTARLEGDEWVLRGHKLWPTNTGGVADLLAVPCTTRLGSSDPEDFAVVFVPADLPGVTQGGPYEKAGMAADKNGDVWLEDVRVPAHYRAHGPGRDAEVFTEAMPLGQVASVGFLVGAMMDVYEKVYRFATERTYRNAPLKENDGVAGVLARIAGDVDICRILGTEAARMADRRGRAGGDPLGSEATAARIRYIKAFVADRALRCLEAAMDLLGPYGPDRAFDVEKHWRDVKMIQLWMGGKQLCQMEAARCYFDCETL